eukprot:s2165_g3.t3
MSGYLPFSRSFQPTPGALRTPVLHCHGSADQLVQLPWADAGVQRLREVQIDVEWRLYDMGHSACEEELEDVAEWMAERIPFLIVWNLGLAVLVLSPVCVALFLMHPIRLSRAAVFVQSLVCAVYSLAFFIQLMVWSLHRHWRPWYALTWLVRGTVATEHPLAEKVDCLCGCEYSVSNHALFQLIVISITGLVKSLTVAFRCIKGLRRSQWANLISVLFSVPINVYPVTWASLPDAHWPEMCDEDSETQGERAFDPFVLMDEQLNSKSLRLQVAAVQTSCGSPRAGDLTPREADTIGCCGFPYARKRVDLTDSSPETPMIMID